MGNVEIGNRYGKLVVIAEAPPDRYNKKVVCRCDCGTEKEFHLGNLVRGKTKSCGCGISEANSKRMTTHGSRHTRLYSIWTNMKTRCHNANTRSYQDYGMRGIKICDEWSEDFTKFEAWAHSNGYQDNLTIERVNVNGNYEPENCTWIPAEEQSNNKTNTRRVELNGIEDSMKGWCKRLGLKYKVVHQAMMKHGENPKDTIIRYAKLKGEK